MIPHSRPVINETDIAARARVPLATWQRHDAPGRGKGGGRRADDSDCPDGPRPAVPQPPPVETD
ncbi:hypothetical protein [Streptomyces sp. NPDC004266]|uniref:hypothetical protein n=1 Tax=Streptomyces sp. NPDC004266 TaxID=3364693 RepID=UPI0036868818